MGLTNGFDVARWMWLWVQLRDVPAAGLLGACGTYSLDRDGHAEQCARMCACQEQPSTPLFFATRYDGIVHEDDGSGHDGHVVVHVV